MLNAAARVVSDTRKFDRGLTTLYLLTSLLTGTRREHRGILLELFSLIFSIAVAGNKQSLSAEYTLCTTECQTLTFYVTAHSKLSAYALYQFIIEFSGVNRARSTQPSIPPG